MQQQDVMNRRTFQMTQLLEDKRCEIVARTKHLTQMSEALEERSIKIEAMEAKYQAQSNAASDVSTDELEKELAQLQLRYEAQSLECEKINEIVLNTEFKFR